jgi:dTDP-4-dehydrorhamnose reductase
VLSTTLDALHPTSLGRVLAEAKPDAVVNCIAITPRSPLASDSIACIRVNSLFPHYLAKACRTQGSYLVHISTDGVYSGRRGNYAEEDLPDPPDLYGRSKLLGEVVGDGCLTLRTSFFGYSPDRPGLVNWLVSQNGQRIIGYANYVFSGLSVSAVCRFMIVLLQRPTPLVGLYHLAGLAMSKYDLLLRLVEKLDLDIVVDPAEEPVVDRSLKATRLYQEVQVRVPSISELIDDVGLEFRGARH